MAWPMRSVTKASATSPRMTRLAVLAGQREIDRLERALAIDARHGVLGEERRGGVGVEPKPLEMIDDRRALAGIVDHQRQQVLVESLSQPVVRRRQGRDGIAQVADPLPRSVPLRELVEAIANRTLGAGHPAGDKSTHDVLPRLKNPNTLHGPGQF